MLRHTSAFFSHLSHGTSILTRVLQSLLAIVIAGVVYRYCWTDASDPFKCGALLNKGQWLDPGSEWSSQNPFQHWQPPGCLMHEYKKEDIQECFRSQRLVFIGDSTTRQIFWAVANKMNHERADEEISEVLDPAAKHKDLEFYSDGVMVKFIWDPWLNSTGLERELSRFSPDPSTDGVDGSAALILLGAPGLWYARHGQANFHKDFRDSIDAVIPYMDHVTGEHIIPMPESVRRLPPNVLLLAPVQVPWYPSLSPSRQETITPEKIDQMNDYLQQVSQHSRADVVWSYSLMTWTGRVAYKDSGLHIVDSIAHRKADILLNSRCNAFSASKGPPFNRTCCSNYSRPNVLQWSVLILGMLVLPILSYLRRKHVAKYNRLLPPASILNALAAFTIVVCFCFYADRTQVFDKAPRQFREREFLTSCAVVAAAGILSTRRIPPEPPSKKILQTSQYDGFLSRTLTNELKGWMQALILIYHYTHASKTLWVYEIVRLLVASYLFLTGFGHTMYFLSKEDYSLRRISGILVRINLLTCALPYMMRTDYLFYYFAPLASFWFLVIYFTLNIGRDRNSDLNYVLAKICVSAALTTAFTAVPGILEFIAILLKYTCSISWNIKEWRFRMFLDMYIVYIGMIVGMLNHRISKLRSGLLTPDTTVDTALRFTITYPRTFQAITTVLSLIVLRVFWLLGQRSTNKEDYNRWHPYISFVPILSFVALRNSSHMLRGYHSALFAWLGRYSLETYVLQYHIWLAGDATVLLRLGLWNRWVEAAILTPIFLWASWATANATQVLTSWIVYGNVSSLRDEQASTVQLAPGVLPRVFKDKDTVLISDGGEEDGETGYKYFMSFRHGLRWRLGLMILLLWVANMTYE